MKLFERFNRKPKEKTNLPALIKRPAKAMKSQVPVFMNGQQFLVPRTCTGREIKQAAGCGPGRMLVFHHVQSETVIQIFDNDVLDIPEGSEFEDLPIGRWGDITYAE